MYFQKGDESVALIAVSLMALAVFGLGVLLGRCL